MEDFDTLAADWQGRIEAVAELLELASCDGGKAAERAALVCAGSLRDTAAAIGEARAARPVDAQGGAR